MYQWLCVGSLVSGPKNALRGSEWVFHMSRNWSVLHVICVSNIAKLVQASDNHQHNIRVDMAVYGMLSHKQHGCWFRSCTRGNFCGPKWQFLNICNFWFVRLISPQFKKERYMYKRWTSTLEKSQEFFGNIKLLHGCCYGGN